MKLSELTNEQKTRLLAELDGYEHPMYINPKTGHLVVHGQLDYLGN